MSYPYTSADQGNYPYATSSYSTSVPQYTEAQIQAYYQQWQCYPPGQYTVVPSTYSVPTQQVAVPSYTTNRSTAPAQYGDNSGGVDIQDLNRLAPPMDEAQLHRRRSHKADRRSRSTSRTRTWTCDYPNCTSTANFTRLADLQRHQATVHGVGVPEFPCTVPRCNRVGEKGFTRRDHLVEHLRNFHHMPIPKRKPGERSANPLGLPPFY